MIIEQDQEFVMNLQRFIEFIGTFAFALSGIRLAASKHYDWLGGFVCGIAVAIGGGTIRDVMLGVRPFWQAVDARTAVEVDLDAAAHIVGCRTYGDVVFGGSGKNPEAAQKHERP